MVTYGLWRHYPSLYRQGRSAPPTGFAFCRHSPPCRLPHTTPSPRSPPLPVLLAHCLAPRPHRRRASHHLRRVGATNSLLFWVEHAYTHTNHICRPIYPTTSCDAPLPTADNRRALAALTLTFAALRLPHPPYYTAAPTLLPTSVKHCASFTSWGWWDVQTGHGAPLTGLRDGRTTLTLRCWQAGAAARVVAGDAPPLHQNLLTRCHAPHLPHLFFLLLAGGL